MKNIALFVILCAVTVLVVVGCSKPAETGTPATDTNAPSATTTNQ